MTSLLKNVSQSDVKQVGQKPPVVQPTGMLNHDAENRRERQKATKSQDTTQSADQHNHSNWIRNKSDSYHAEIIGGPRPAASGVALRRTRAEMQSTRPGLTAQRGLGG